MNNPRNTDASSGPSIERRGIGAVTLIVRDIERVAAFYRDVIGLKLLGRVDARTLAMGVADVPLLVLEGRPDAPVAPARSPGLFHTAFLLPARADLARQLTHLANARVPLHGLSDHGISEAIYLADPEGNGIEIYADRPRDAWPVDASGALQMTTDPLDVEQLMRTPAANEAFAGMPPGTIVGHVHLRVSDLLAAERFYRDALGMNVTTRYGNAATFLSYDGYHHHLGLNTWGSLHAPPPPIGSAGLKHVVIHGPRDVHNAELRDPSGNQIIVQHREG